MAASGVVKNLPRFPRDTVKFSSLETANSEAGKGPEWPPVTVPVLPDTGLSDVWRSFPTCGVILCLQDVAAYPVLLLVLDRVGKQEGNLL